MPKNTPNQRIDIDNSDKWEKIPEDIADNDKGVSINEDKTPLPSLDISNINNEISDKKNTINKILSEKHDSMSNNDKEKKVFIYIDKYYQIKSIIDNDKEISQIFYNELQIGSPISNDKEILEFIYDYHKEKEHEHIDDLFINAIEKTIILIKTNFESKKKFLIKKIFETSNIYNSPLSIQLLIDKLEVPEIKKDFKWDDFITNLNYATKICFIENEFGHKYAFNSYVLIKSLIDIHDRLIDYKPEIARFINDSYLLDNNIATLIKIDWDNGLEIKDIKEKISSLIDIFDQTSIQQLVNICDTTDNNTKYQFLYNLFKIIEKSKDIIKIVENSFFEDFCNTYSSEIDNFNNISVGFTANIFEQLYIKIDIINTFLSDLLIYIETKIFNKIALELDQSALEINDKFKLFSSETYNSKIDLSLLSGNIEKLKAFFSFIDINNFSGPNKRIDIHNLANSLSKLKCITPLIQQITEEKKDYPYSTKLNSDTNFKLVLNNYNTKNLNDLYITTLDICIKKLKDYSFNDFYQSIIYLYTILIGINKLHQNSIVFLKKISGSINNINKFIENINNEDQKNKLIDKILTNINELKNIDITSVYGSIIENFISNVKLYSQISVIIKEIDNNLYKRYRSLIDPNIDISQKNYDDLIETISDIFLTLKTKWDTKNKKNILNHLTSLAEASNKVSENISNNTFIFIEYNEIIRLCDQIDNIESINQIIKFDSNIENFYLELKEQIYSNIIQPIKCESFNISLKNFSNICNNTEQIKNDLFLKINELEKKAIIDLDLIKEILHILNSISDSISNELDKTKTPILLSQNLLTSLNKELSSNSTNFNLNTIERIIRSLFCLEIGKEIEQVQINKWLYNLSIDDFFDILEEKEYSNPINLVGVKSYSNIQKIVQKASKMDFLISFIQKGNLEKLDIISKEDYNDLLRKCNYNIFKFFDDYANLIKSNDNILKYKKVTQDLLPIINKIKEYQEEYKCSIKNIYILLFLVYKSLPFINNIQSKFSNNITPEFGSNIGDTIKEIESAISEFLNDDNIIIFNPKIDIEQITDIPNINDNKKSSHTTLVTNILRDSTVPKLTSPNPLYETVLGYELYELIKNPEYNLLINNIRNCINVNEFIKGSVILQYKTLLKKTKIKKDNYDLIRGNIVSYFFQTFGLLPQGISLEIDLGDNEAIVRFPPPEVRQSGIKIIAENNEGKEIIIDDFQSTHSFSTQDISDIFSPDNFKQIGFMIPVIENDEKLIKIGGIKKVAIVEISKHIKYKNKNYLIKNITFDHFDYNNIKTFVPGDRITVQITKKPEENLGFIFESYCTSLVQSENTPRIFGKARIKPGSSFFNKANKIYEYAIFTEYKPGITLNELIKSKNSIINNEYNKDLITKSIVQTIFFIQKNGFKNLDLKPGNILIDCKNNEPQVSIIDFASCNPITLALIRDKKEVFGSVKYMDPRINKNINDIYLDYYSLGIVLFELYSEKEYIKTIMDEIIKVDFDKEKEKKLLSDSSIIKNQKLADEVRRFYNNPSIFNDSAVRRLIFRLHFCRYPLKGYILEDNNNKPNNKNEFNILDELNIESIKNCVPLLLSNDIKKREWAFRALVNLDYTKDAKETDFLNRISVNNFSPSTLVEGKIMPLIEKKGPITKKILNSIFKKKK